ncbi:MAG: hypothetical protein OEM52_02715 [bacterium]|nr:hypothetical protein [bacterium]
MSLGYRTALADFLWIRAVLYMGATIPHDHDHQHQHEHANNHHDHETGHEHSGSYSETENHVHTDSCHHDEGLNNQSLPTEPINPRTFNFRSLPALQKSLYKNENSDYAPALLPLLERIVALDPFFFRVYEKGAMKLAFSCGRSEEALVLINHGLEVFPNATRLYYLRGLILLFYQDDFDFAVADFVKVMRLNSQQPIELYSQEEMTSPQFTQFVREMLVNFRSYCPTEEMKAEIDQAIRDVTKRIPM